VSPVGRWSAIGAATLGLITVATWNRAESPSAIETPPSGAALFTAKGCATCHAGPDSTAAFDSGFPSLADAPSWAGDRRPDLTAAEYLTESMAAPGVFISPEFRVGQSGPTTAMPQLQLTSEEIDALVDYLLAQ
jgi:mono/diheme cytochrome c family protein